MLRRTTRILLVLLALIAVGTVVSRRSATPSLESVPTAAGETLWMLSADQVDQLRLVGRSDGGLLVARRDPQSGWRMTAPRIAPADAGRIEMALAGLLSPDVHQSLEDPGDLSSFGLEPPQAQLTLILTDGSSRSLDVGRIDPTGSVYYVRLPGRAEVAMLSRYSVDDLLGLIGDSPVAPGTATPTGSAAEPSMR